MERLKLATMMFTWNGVGDRFLSRYFEPQGIESIVPGLQGGPIEGVELQHPRHVAAENAGRVKELLARYRLAPVIVNIPMASDLRWKRGSFSHPSAEVRAMAVERVNEALDACRLVGADRASLFLGQDGFDYPLVSDYRRAWDHLVECFAQCADYAPDIRLCIEYKPREPRTHQYLSSAAKTLLLARETGRNNVGLLADIGHAWMAGEGFGETVCLAARENRLFHIHMNDNFRVDDDDLGVGGMHLAEYLEALYWLREVDYRGWVSLDVHSPRERSEEIILESAALLRNLDRLLERIGMEKLRALTKTCDGTQALRLLNREILERCCAAPGREKA